MHRYGFKNTVACLGTAVTKDHLRQLKRFADNVIICLDGDAAGQKATLRTLEVFREMPELNVKVATLPAGQDPDEFLKANGIRTRIRHKPSEGSEEVLDSIRAGYVSYVINTRAILSGVHYEDGVAIRSAATQNNITMLTSLDTVKVLLDVLEEVTIGVSPIDAE